MFLLWLRYKDNNEKSHGDDLRELDKFRTCVDQDLISLNFKTQVHKDWLDDHRTNINELWTSIYLLQGLMQAQATQIEQLQMELNQQQQEITLT